MKLNVALLFGLIEARRNFAPEQGAWPEGSRRRQVRNELPQGKPTLDDFDIMSEFRGSPLDADIPELARFEQLADKKDEVMEKMKKFGLGQKPQNPMKQNLKKKPFKVTKYQMPKYKSSNEIDDINKDIDEFLINITENYGTDRVVDALMEGYLETGMNADEFEDIADGINDQLKHYASKKRFAKYQN